MIRRRNAPDDEAEISHCVDDYHPTLTPSMPVSLERRDLALIRGDLGHYAHAENLLSQWARFSLKREEADSLVAEMERRIAATWYETAHREGGPELDCETIKTAFVYPEFRLDLGE